MSDDDRRFEAVWQAIKNWDIGKWTDHAGRPSQRRWYSGATGDDVRTILAAIDAVADEREAPLEGPESDEWLPAWAVDLRRRLEALESAQRTWTQPITNPRPLTAGHDHLVGVGLQLLRCASCGTTVSGLLGRECSSCGARMQAL